MKWSAVAEALHAEGWARLGKVLDAPTCRTLARGFGEAAPWRKTIDMARHRYGEGEYRYYAYPLPEPVAALRRELYAGLAPVANAWAEALRRPADYPPDLASYLARCHAAGQTRPTPLVLRYGAGGWNALHQDVYGPLAFPLQVVVLLSDPRDFEGGELLLVEQRPRAQSRGTALTLARGEAIAFASQARPAKGARGFHAVRVRHGVSTLWRGERYTLGIIFHDAR